MNLRLRTLEALRYGALENGCLDDLAEGLTVVLGPNESGKSTFTSLTRHVLYGYPDGRARERGYEPPAGARHARLVFGSAEGEWAVERKDGTKRGPVTVTALAGPERPDLLEHITAGVSEQAYRVVFGFGLDELAEIEHSDKSDIVSRLYAAGTGLAVNPMDVRAALASMAGDLYGPRKSKPTVNMFAAKAKATRERIRELEQTAAHFAGEQQRLAQLTSELGPLKTRRNELDLSRRALERAAQRVAGALEQQRAVAGRVGEIDSELERMRRERDRVSVDDAALQAAPAARALLDDASAYRERLTNIATLEAGAAEAARKAGSYDHLPDQVSDSPEVRADVERWRERIGDARRAADGARLSAEQAIARAEAMSDRPAAGPSGRGRQEVVLVAVLGAIAIGAGFLTGQWLAAVLGGVLLVGAAGVAFLRPPKLASPLAGDLERIQAEAASARKAAERSAELHAEVLAQWRTWLAEARLCTYGEDPVAVLGLLEELRERDRIADERDRLQAQALRERDVAEEWLARLFEVAHEIDAQTVRPAGLSSGLELAERVRGAIENAQRANSERERLTARMAGSESERETLVAQLEEAGRIVAETAAAHEVEIEGAEDTLTASAEEMRLEHESVSERYEALAEEAAGLRSRLDEVGRDDAMARARQDLEGLRAQAAEAADRYLVTELAVRLIDRARERYEQQRQPEVVRTAARVFSAMTGGRYRNLRVPLDNSGIMAIASDGTVRPTGELSRGTAEQLYLALRVGLISTMGETGASLPVLMDDVVVNFDAERRTGAVVAIAELAAARQVLYFTCHDETAAELVAAVDDARLVELGRCALRA